MAESDPAIKHYYVDEAGDPTLFSAHGSVLVGKEGCSRYFILGMLDVAHSDALVQELDGLRTRLMADPYFSGVPSMQTVARKTAQAFHAKDDLAEVRREVFAVLLKHELRFHAVVRDKLQVLAYVRQKNERNDDYRYSPNELYDLTVSRLFKDKLHKADTCNITFARRGKSDRTAALRKALLVAQTRFYEKYGIVSQAQISTHAEPSAGSVALQAADYFLWALQRLYERGEDRYVKLLWPAFRLVQDVDDTRRDRYEVYYTQKTPLTAATVKQK